MSRKKELEIVQHTNMNHLEIFFVEMTARGPHGHDDLEIGVLLKGTVTLVLEQKSYILQEGDIYLINRHQVHSFARTDTDNLILAVLKITLSAAAVCMIPCLGHSMNVPVTISKMCPITP